MTSLPVDRLVVAEERQEWAVRCPTGVHAVYENPDDAQRRVEQLDDSRPFVIACGPHRVFSRRVFVTTWEEQQ